MNNKIVVVKTGTSLITRESDSLNKVFLKGIVDDVAVLQSKGIKVILVSSGAVASGRHELKDELLKEDKGSVSYRQMLSAVGQGRLIQEYHKLFNKHDIKIAQVLLTDIDFNDRVRYLNVRNTMNLLLNNNIVPIINENDVTATQELTVGDNDFLAAYVALMVKADKLLLLTDVNGLCSDNPKLNKDAIAISLVPEINAHIRSLAKKNTEGSRGLGGMTSKINATDIATNGGVPTIITNGRIKGNIIDIILNNKLDIGTFFPPKSDRITSRKSWLSSKIKKNVKIIVDEGAATAIKKNGRSLLPAGAKSIKGKFERGDVVEVWYRKKKIGYGQVNYNAKDLQKILGRKSSEIKKILPVYYGEEVIHRDSFVKA